MNIRQTKQRLRYSLEMEVLKRNLTITVVIVTALTLFYGLVIRGGYQQYFWEKFWLLAAMMYGLMVLPLLIFTVVRTIRIFKKPEGYIFCRSTLCNLHSGPLRDTMYYTVVLEDPEDGSKFFVDTHAIFATHGSIPPTIEEYTNKTVTIAYNRETEMVVVIG